MEYLGPARTLQFATRALISFVQRCGHVPMSQAPLNPTPGSLAAQEHPRNFPLQVFALAFLVPLAYAAYTNHAWDDWYITFRAAKNLAVGNGLVFTIGERVHSFTSPLGTLIPALLSYMTGNVSDDLVLWLYRIINCAVLGAAAINLLAILRHLKVDFWLSILAIGMVILDAKLVDFSINGMETAFMAFFLVLAIRAHVIPVARPVLTLGLAWAGLMWTRPDSVIYIAALAFAFLVFPCGRERSRAGILRQYFQSGLVALLVYGPWLIWAWSYYGSFVPHTIVAKGLRTYTIPLVQEASTTIQRMLAFPLTGLFRGTSLHQVFAPSYVNLGGWPSLFWIGGYIAWICAFAWVFPFLRPVTRALSVVALLAHLYLGFIVKFVYPWYLPSVMIITVMIFALLVDQILAREQRFNSARLKSSIALMFLAVTVAITLCTAYQIALQQEIIESNRRHIGVWLRDNSTSHRDRVFLEPLGYIGFFSNLKMYDFPGLSSPEVVAARRSLRTDDYARLIAYLRPEWLVLRPKVVKRIGVSNRALLEREYSVARVFDVSKDVDSIAILPGRAYLKFDQTFVVYRRNDARLK